MTIQEKRKALDKFCDEQGSCMACPLKSPVCRCGVGTHFLNQNFEGRFEMTGEEIEAAYDIAFPRKADVLDSIDRQLTGPAAGMTRPEILAAAKACVCGDREQDYGSPENNFETIAVLWSTYIRALRPESKDWAFNELGAKDVAAMLALLKIARIASGRAKADNWIDLAGYAACGGEIEAGGQA